MHVDPKLGAPQRIAIVGGGIAGLSAAWALSPHHHVTLYEAETRLGGHARTVMAGRRGDQPVDTGFIVFNHATYPQLTALFRDLDVPVEKSDMSFGVSLDNGRLEYALRSADAMFGQRSNILSPGFHRMIRDILRFNSEAVPALERAGDVTIEALVSSLGLGERFRDHYLFPLCGAIWSTPAERIGSFPARALLRFMQNHALMSTRGQHQWWTVSGGSISYVERLAMALRHQGADLRTGAPVQLVTRVDGGVLLTAKGSTPERYDHIVLAGHADQSLALLADASEAERAALGAIRFQPNRATLHRDPSVMPDRRRCWSSWVYRASPGTPSDRTVGVTYWMNRLQNTPQDDPLFVTLNADRPIPQEAIYDEVVFHHPMFDHQALAAQETIAAMQGLNRTWFVGAWLRNGFHEDGIESAMRVARGLVPQRVAA